MQTPEIMPRKPAALPDLRTLTIEQFVDFFVAQIEEREDVLALMAQAVEAHARVTALTISDQPAYDVAGEELRTVRTLTKSSEASRFEITRPIDGLKKRVMDIFKPIESGLDITDTLLTGRMATYKTEQDRKDREARRLAEEKANRERAELERKAREERAAAEAKARVDRDAARKAEEDGRLAEAARLRNTAAATVEKAEAKAEKLLDRAADVVAAPPPVSAAPAKTKGVSDRRVWRYEITNRELVPAEFRVIDERRIADRVKSLKGDTRIPGVRVWDEADFSVRGK